MTKEALVEGQKLLAAIKALEDEFQAIEKATVISFKLENGKKIDYICDNKSLRGQVAIRARREFELLYMDQIVELQAKFDKL